MNESTKQRQNESIQKRLDSSPAMNDRRRAHCKVSCMNPLNRGRLRNEWARARGIRALAWDCGISTLWLDCRPSGIRPRPFSDTAAPETLACYLMNGQRALESLCQKRRQKNPICEIARLHLMRASPLTVHCIPSTSKNKFSVKINTDSTPEQ